MQDPTEHDQAGGGWSNDATTRRDFLQRIGGLAAGAAIGIGLDETVRRVGEDYTLFYDAVKPLVTGESFNLLSQESLDSAYWRGLMEIDSYKRILPAENEKSVEGARFIGRPISLRDGMNDPEFLPGQLITAAMLPMVPSGNEAAATRLTDINIVTIDGEPYLVASLYSPFVGKGDPKRYDMQGVILSGKDIARFLKEIPQGAANQQEFARLFLKHRLPAVRTFDTTLVHGFNDELVEFQSKRSSEAGKVFAEGMRLFFEQARGLVDKGDGNFAVAPQQMGAIQKSPDNFISHVLEPNRHADKDVPALLMSILNQEPEDSTVAAMVLTAMDWYPNSDNPYLGVLGDTVYQAVREGYERATGQAFDESSIPTPERISNNADQKGVAVIVIRRGEGAKPEDYTVLAPVTYRELTGDTALFRGVEIEGYAIAGGLSLMYEQSDNQFQLLTGKGPRLSSELVRIIQ